MIKSKFSLLFIFTLLFFCGCKKWTDKNYYKDCVGTNQISENIIGSYFPPYNVFNEENFVSKYSNNISNIKYIPANNYNLFINEFRDYLKSINSDFINTNEFSKITNIDTSNCSIVQFKINQIYSKEDVSNKCRYCYSAHVIDLSIDSLNNTLTINYQFKTTEKWYKKQKAWDTYGICTIALKYKINSNTKVSINEKDPLYCN